jgi:hypothetical protein
MTRTAQSRRTLAEMGPGHGRCGEHDSLCNKFHLVGGFLGGRGVVEREDKLLFLWLVWTIK